MLDMLRWFMGELCLKLPRFFTRAGWVSQKCGTEGVKATQRHNDQDAKPHLELATSCPSSVTSLANRFLCVAGCACHVLCPVAKSR